MWTKEYTKLLQRICVGSGFCGSVQDGRPVHVDDFIPKDGEVTADQFAEWVIKAENMEFSPYGSHAAMIRSAFIDCFGSDVVEIGRIRS